MPLTDAQKQTLKADILVNPDALALYTAGDNQRLAALYNQQAVPPFTVWKTNVPIPQIGDNIVATELDGMTQLNLIRLQTVVQLSVNGYNFALADRRSFFSINGNTAEGIFSGTGGALSRPKLLTLAKRLATRAEKLFATGPGTDPSPATLTFEGAIRDVELIGL